MSTLWDDILREANGEKIEAVVIGEFGSGYANDDSKDQAVAPVRGRILSAEQAKQLLDYEYDTGHGSPDSHHLYAWTKSYVIYGTEYDGATGVDRVPRNPTEGVPRWY